jgi:hypothetical protein
VTPIVSINYDNGTGKKQRSLQNQLQINNKIAPQHIKPFLQIPNRLDFTTQQENHVMETSSKYREIHLFFSYNHDEFTSTISKFLFSEGHPLKNG